jgi:hypothetical protein
LGGVEFSIPLYPIPSRTRAPRAFLRNDSSEHFSGTLLRNNTSSERFFGTLLRSPSPERFFGTLRLRGHLTRPASALDFDDIVTVRRGNFLEESSFCQERFESFTCAFEDYHRSYTFESCRTWAFGHTWADTWKSLGAMLVDHH